MVQLRGALEVSPAMGEKILPVAERIGMLPEHAQRPPARKPASARQRIGSGKTQASQHRNQKQRQRETPPPRPRRDERGGHAAR